jgi:hypothetical protein
MQYQLIFILILLLTLIQCQYKSGNSYYNLYQSNNLCYSITEEFHELQGADTIIINKIPNDEFYAHLSDILNSHINKNVDTVKLAQTEMNCALINEKTTLVFKSLDRNEIMSPGWHLIYSPLLTYESKIYQIVGFQNGRRACRYILLSGKISKGKYRVTRTIPLAVC